MGDASQPPSTAPDPTPGAEETPVVQDDATAPVDATAVTPIATTVVAEAVAAVGAVPDAAAVPAAAGAAAVTAPATAGAAAADGVATAAEDGAATATPDGAGAAAAAAPAATGAAATDGAAAAGAAVATPTAAVPEDLPQPIAEPPRRIRALRVALAKVVLDHANKPYGAYYIEVDGSQVIRRRYSEFLALHRAVQKEFPKLKLPPFPPKKLFNNLDDAVLESRRKAFDRYLRALVRNKQARSHKVVQRFLFNAALPFGATLEQVIRRVDAVSYDLRLFEHDLQRLSPRPHDQPMPNILAAPPTSALIPDDDDDDDDQAGDGTGTATSAAAGSGAGDAGVGDGAGKKAAPKPLDLADAARKSSPFKTVAWKFSVEETARAIDAGQMRFRTRRRRRGSRGSRHGSSGSSSGSRSSRKSKNAIHGDTAAAAAAAPAAPALVANPWMGGQQQQQQRAAPKRHSPPASHVGNEPVPTLRGLCSGCLTQSPQLQKAYAEERVPADLTKGVLREAEIIAALGSGTGTVTELRLQEMLTSLEEATPAASTTPNQFNHNAFPGANAIGPRAVHVTEVVPVPGVVNEVLLSVMSMLDRNPVSTSKRNVLIVLNTEAGKVRLTIPTKLPVVKVVPLSDQCVVAGFGDHIVRVYNLCTGKMLHDLVIPDRPDVPPLSKQRVVEFLAPLPHRRGHVLCGTDSSENFAVLDAEAGTFIRTFSAVASPPGSVPVNQPAPGMGIFGMPGGGGNNNDRHFAVLLPHHRVAAASAASNKLSIFDWHSGKTLFADAHPVSQSFSAELLATRDILVSIAPSAGHNMLFGGGFFNNTSYPTSVFYDASKSNGLTEMPLSLATDEDISPTHLHAIPGTPFFTAADFSNYGASSVSIWNTVCESGAVERVLSVPDSKSLMHVSIRTPLVSSAADSVRMYATAYVQDTTNNNNNNGGGIFAFGGGNANEQVPILKIWDFVHRS